MIARIIADALKIPSTFLERGRIGSFLILRVIDIIAFRSRPRRRLDGSRARFSEQPRNRNEVFVIVHKSNIGLSYSRCMHVCMYMCDTHCNLVSGHLTSNGRKLTEKKIFCTLARKRKKKMDRRDRNS